MPHTPAQRFHLPAPPPPTLHTRLHTHAHLPLFPRRLPLAYRIRGATNRRLTSEDRPGHQRVGAETAPALGAEGAHGPLPEGQPARLAAVGGGVPWKRPRHLGGEGVFFRAWEQKRGGLTLARGLKLLSPLSWFLCSGCCRCCGNWTTNAPSSAQLCRERLCWPTPGKAWSTRRAHT